MSSITDAARQVQAAADLPEELQAARHAFEEMLAEIQAWQDPDSPLFTPFVMSAGYAADGRDAILFAPSRPWPSAPLGQVTAIRRPAEESAEQAAGALVALCDVLTAQLDQAAASAPGRDDREACREAAKSARIVRDLLAGTER
jgi:hypothetical protein